MSYQNQKYRTIFTGTSEFGIPSLKKLASSDLFELVAIITQLDKKIGRKQILSPTPIKKEAQTLGIDVWQNEKIINLEPEIAKKNIDFLIVSSYGQIIPEQILNLPRYGSFNIHASLLPRYRGAAVIQAPILNQDKKSGVTIIKMDSGLDTGDILSQEEIKLDPKETSISLHDKLAQLGGKILIPTLLDYVEGKISLKTQDSSKASYVGILKKQDGHLNWKNSASKIESSIRALNPYPGTFSYAKLKDKKILIKILEADVFSQKTEKQKPGTLFSDSNKNLIIACGKDFLKIKKLQLEGKKIMTSQEFLLGYKNLLPTWLE